MYALSTNLFLEKFYWELKKTVKIFLISNKTFSKNDILLCALRAHINKILYFKLT